MEPWKDLSKPHPTHRRPWMICALGYLLLVIGCDSCSIISNLRRPLCRCSRRGDARFVSTTYPSRAERQAGRCDDLGGSHHRSGQPHRISRRAAVELLATPVFNIGDGIQMDVFLVNGSNRNRICSRYFDAGRNAADRQWIAMEFRWTCGTDRAPRWRCRFPEVRRGIW